MRNQSIQSEFFNTRKSIGSISSGKLNGVSNLISVMNKRPKTLNFIKEYFDKVKASIMLKKRQIYLSAIGHKTLKRKLKIKKTKLCNIQEEMLQN